MAEPKTRERITDRAVIPTLSEMPAAGTPAGRETMSGKTERVASAKRAPAAKASAAAKEPGAAATQAAEAVAIVGPAGLTTWWDVVGIDFPNKLGVPNDGCAATASLYFAVGG